MKRVSALVGLAALGGIAVATPASAMPAAIPGQAAQASNVLQAGYACNAWSHCWHRSYISDGYYHRHHYGGWGWHRGWGYGRHRWHRWGGWHPWHRRGYWHPWHHWGYWHHW